MVALACLLKQKLLLLVNKVDLREQFMERMREHTNIADLEKATGRKLMGELYYEDGVPHTYPITVATYQLIAYEDERLRKIKDLFGLVLVDECHRAPADCLTRIIRGMNPLLHIGVSATPRRKDGYHRLLPDLIGPVRFKADVVNNCEVQIVRGAHFPVPNNMNFSKMINIVCKHTGRNRKIVDNVISDINKEGRRVIILTQRVEHSEVLWNMLKQENVRARRISADCSKEEKEERIQKLFALDNAIKYLQFCCVEAEEIDWQLVLTWDDFWLETKELLEKTTQEVRDGVRKLYEERADCLVTTTKLFGEGSDIPPIDTLHLVCPTADDVGMEQMIGRIQREFLRKKSPKAVYYADSGHGILYGCTKKFKRVCEEQFKYSVEDKSDQVFQEGVLL
jgi:superfamily II DNA or RNA helicase